MASVKLKNVREKTPSDAGEEKYSDPNCDSVFVFFFFFYIRRKKKKTIEMLKNVKLKHLNSLQLMWIQNKVKK